MPLPVEQGDERALRESMLHGMRRLAALGLNRGTSGNLSVCCASGFLVTPTGVAPEELQAQAMVAMDLSGRVLGPGKPSSEWRFHCDIFAARPEVARNVPDGIMPTLRRLNFDTALSTSPGALYALRQLVKPNQILFGTDLPFAPEVAMHHTFDGLTKFFSDAAELRAVERENALVLFPRLAAQAATR